MDLERATVLFPGDNVSKLAFLSVIEHIVQLPRKKGDAKAGAAVRITSSSSSVLARAVRSPTTTIEQYGRCSSTHVVVMFCFCVRGFLRFLLVRDVSEMIQKRRRRTPHILFQTSGSPVQFVYSGRTKVSSNHCGFMMDDAASYCPPPTIVGF